MKKYLITSFIILIIPLFFSMNVHAESEPNENGNGYAYVTTGLNYGSTSGGGNTATIYSNYKLCICKEYMPNDNYLILTADLLNDSEPHICSIDSVANSKNIRLIAIDNYNPGSNIYITGYMNQNANFSWNWTFQMSTSYANTQTVIPLFDTLEEAESYILHPDIDFSWTNVSYDSTIPTPSLDVDLTKNINEKVFNSNPQAALYGQLGPEIPYYLGIKASTAYEDYYLYLDMTIWTPTSGELKLENGIYTFTPKSMYKTKEIAYFNWGDMKTAPTSSNFFYNTNAPLLGSTTAITQQDNLENWYNIRRHIELGTGDYPEMSYTTSLTGTPRDTGISRINQMLRNASLAGNRIRFRACLYYINENNEIKCGNFATWTSAQPSSPTSEQPSTNAQVVDLPASGISQTVSYDNIVSQNESTNNIPPVNVTTGGANVNVTVNTGNQNVPNNQNYPTVVSYNHDNIFTTFVGTYNSATQYLGGFAQFCNSCLLWIPSEIWSIIGMGFAMALVIMIVKIL